MGEANDRNLIKRAGQAAEWVPGHHLWLHRYGPCSCCLARIPCGVTGACGQRQQGQGFGLKSMLRLSPAAGRRRHSLLHYRHLLECNWVNTTCACSARRGSLWMMRASTRAAQSFCVLIRRLNPVSMCMHEFDAHAAACWQHTTYAMPSHSRSACSKAEIIGTSAAGL